MASSLIEQINTVSKLARTIKDEKSRGEVLSAQAVSILEQLRNVTLAGSDCDQLVEAIETSAFSDESKTELGKAVLGQMGKVASKAVLGQMGKVASKVPKNQTVEDIGPCLTEADVEVLSNVDMTLLSKVQRLARVLARLLMDDMIGYDIPETIMFDWFHIYLVHGVCNIECGLVLGGLRDAGFPESRVCLKYVSKLTGRQTAGSSPKNILQAARDKKTSPLKASASELLNFVPLLRLFVLLFVCGHVDSVCLTFQVSFLLLVQVLDLLQIVARGGSTTAPELGAAIRRHLECHLKDTAKKYEESLLQDIMAVQLKALKQDMPSTEVRLLHKTKATKKLHELMRETLQCHGECFHALSAVHGGGFECSRGDVVQFHAEMMDRPMTCIVPWSHVHGWAYTVTESAQPVLVDTGAISGCCLWSQKDASALVIRA
eukprot:s9165_g2.t1